MVTRRQVLGLVSVALLPIGCLASEQPFADISDADAEERVQQAEKAFVVGQLSDADCLEDWSEYGVTAADEATVRERRENGVVVDVREAYSYWTQEDEVDAVVESVYLVTENDEARIDGDAVAPC
jgi:hypothetical protein